jgi:hypothetical protein
MGDWVEDIIPQRFSKLDYLFGMEGRAKPAAFTTKGKQILISTIATGTLANPFSDHHMSDTAGLPVQ